MERRGFVASIGGLVSAAWLAATSRVAAKVVELEEQDMPAAEPVDPDAEFNAMIDSAAMAVRRRIDEQHYDTTLSMTAPMRSFPNNQYMRSRLPRCHTDAGFQPFVLAFLDARCDDGEQCRLMHALFARLFQQYIDLFPLKPNSYILGNDRLVRVLTPRWTIDVDELATFGRSSPMLIEAVTNSMAGIESRVKQLVAENGPLVCYGRDVYLKREAFILEMFVWITVGPRHDTVLS